MPAAMVSLVCSGTVPRTGSGILCLESEVHGYFLINQETLSQVTALCSYYCRFKAKTQMYSAINLRTGRVNIQVYFFEQVYRIFSL